MKLFVSILLSLLCNTVLVGYATASPSHCPPSEGLSLQILGSGGPIADDDRASTSYLSGYLDGSGGLVKLEPSEIDPRLHKASLVYKHTTDDIEVIALGVPHGPVPTLAFRVRIGQKSIVFSGDQNGSSDAFVDFARGTDVLVMHMPVPETISGVGRNLHAPPSVIGDIAAKTDTRLLVLSHFMARSLDHYDDSLKEIRSRYQGPLVSAHDLECVNF